MLKQADATKIIQMAETQVKASNEAVMLSSAHVCLMDARHLNERGFHEYAARRALKAVAYVVGELHPKYAEVRNVIRLKTEA